MRRKPQPPPEPAEPSHADSKLPPWLEVCKNCLLLLVGISLMAYGEWLAFEKEQSKREFFERQERIEDVRDRVRESLERARATRTPINFDDIWDAFDEGVERSRRERKARERAAQTAPVASRSPAEGR